MESIIQQRSRQSDREYQKRQGLSGLFEGQVTSANALTDSMGVSYGPAPERSLPILHPFNGTTSWIRSVPERGTRLLMGNRFDSGQPEPLATLPAGPEKRTTDYQSQLNTYRTLSPGEHDFSSSGLATVYLSKRGHLDMRSGSGVKQQLSRENNHHVTSAPTIIRTLLNRTVGEMGDEERLGLVRRWKLGSDIDEFYPKSLGNFRAEHYLKLMNPALFSPEVLYRKVTGHVYEDEGTEGSHFTTGSPLRHQELWYTDSDEFVRLEIDTSGNYLLELPSPAQNGFELIVPEGNFKAQIGVDWDLTISGNESHAVTGNVRHTIEGALDYEVTSDANFGAGQNTLEMNAASGFINMASGGGAVLELEASGQAYVEASKVKLGASSASQALARAKETDARISNIEQYLLNFVSLYLTHMHLETFPPATPTSPPMIPAPSFSPDLSVIASSIVFSNG